MTDFYDRQGKLITDAEDGTPATLVWARLYEDHEYRQVKVSKVDEDAKVWVSTIWMGFDMNAPSFYADSVPFLFETVLAQDIDGRSVIHHTFRDPTEENAVATHDHVVEQWRRYMPGGIQAEEE